MAFHQRKLIRDAVVAQLTGKTDAELRVYPTRELPLKVAELPAVCIYTLEETVSPESRSSSPRRLTRSLQLGVEIIVRATEAVDDALDALSLQVEVAIDADPRFGDTCIDSILSSVQIGIDNEGNRPTGRCLMSYAVEYETEAPAAADQPALPDFERAHVETNLSGDQAAADRAVDDIAIPTT